MAGSVKVGFAFEDFVLADILTVHEVWTLDNKILDLCFNVKYVLCYIWPVNNLHEKASYSLCTA